MYPLFSGLGGYIFGTNSAGNLDPSNIGVANPKFLKNAKIIDGWNKTGFINSKVDYGVGKDAEGGYEFVPIIAGLFILKIFVA